MKKNNIEIEFRKKNVGVNVGLNVGVNSIQRKKLKRHWTNKVGYGGILLK